VQLRDHAVAARRLLWRIRMRLLLLALVTLVGCSETMGEGGSGGQVATVGDGGVALPDGGAPGGDLGVPRKPPRPSPIAAENQLPGSTGWQLTAHSTGLYGFADRQSYAPGDSVQIHAAADAATSARWELYRMGYYGGALGRLVASGGPVALPQATPAQLDSSTGMVWAAWPTTFTITLDGAAVTGIYLVKLITASAQSYVIFVVREPAEGAPIVWPVAFNTYQAYNAWGGTGLYDNRRSDWTAAAHAFKVSFDRPYEQGDGAGQYFFADHDFNTFAESQGYDIDYIADSDIDTDTHLFAGRALVVLQGHTEYWTADERTAVNGAVTDGTNLAVFGANDLYWQVRFESTNGNPRRVLVGYKEYASIDPFLESDPQHVTDQWRNLGQAENGLIGVMFGEWLWSAAPLVVDDPTSWLWNGAEMKPGAFIPGFCGFEIDRRYDNGNEPAGLAEIGRCNGENHQAQLALGQSTMYTAASGATVFASGTVSWSQALAHAGQWDPRVQQATHNLFAKLAGVGAVGDAPAALSLPPGLPAPAQAPGVVVSTVTTSLTSPTGLAMAPNGDVIVADDNRIVRVTPSTGAVTLVAGGAAGIADGAGAAAAFNQPRGLAVAADGTIYVADTLNHKIRKIVNGNVTTMAGSTEGFADGTPGELDTPTAIVLTPSGTLLIADPWNNRIRALPAAGGALSTWAGSGARASVDGPGTSAQLYFPFALTLLSDGSLAVAESNDGVIRRVGTDAAHTVTTWAGALGRVGWADGPMDQASFQEMINLATRPNGDVVVLDNATYRVRLIAGNQMTTLAGGATATLVDGDGGSAGFAFPRAAAFADAHTLYVTDNGNHALRRIQIP
jgi:hypothetical protein